MQRAVRSSLSNVTYWTNNFRYCVKGLFPKLVSIAVNPKSSLTRDLFLKGFCVQEKLLLNTSLDILRGHLIEHDPPNDASDYDHRIYYRGLSSLGVADEDITRFQSIINQLSLYHGERLDISYIMLNRVRRGAHGLGSGGGWHRDSNRSQYKILIYLSNVDNIECGPFAAFPFTHIFALKIILNMMFSSNPTGSRLDKLKDLGSSSLIRMLCHPTMGSEGTTIIFDGSTVHTGIPVLKAAYSRYALTAYIYPEQECSQRRDGIVFENNI